MAPSGSSRELGGAILPDLMTETFDWLVCPVIMIEQPKTAAYSCCCSAREGFVPTCAVGVSSGSVILEILGLVPAPKVVDTKIMAYSRFIILENLYLLFKSNKYFELYR